VIERLHASCVDFPGWIPLVPLQPFQDLVFVVEDSPEAQSPHGAACVFDFSFLVLEKSVYTKSPGVTILFAACLLEEIPLVFWMDVCPSGLF